MHRNCITGLLVAGFVCLETALAFLLQASAAGTPAPDWELASLNGKIIKFSNVRGRVLILDFWATRCGPCRVEIPHFVELQRQYGDKGLTGIGISLDEQRPEVVKKFVKQLGVNYPIVIGNEKVAEAYGGIDGLPMTFVIDRRGRIASQHIGYEDKATFEKEVQSLL